MSSLRPPSKVRIGAMDFPVTRRRVAGLAPSDYGGYRHRDQLIYVAPDLSKGHASCTLLHEVLHGIFDVYSITRALPIEKSEIRHMAEEDIILKLEVALTCLIRDNPKLIRYIERSLNE